MTTTEASRRQTLASFDWQWSHLPSGDFMPGDPWFDANATRVLTNELCAIDPRWFVGKRALDAGCGRGRWTRSLLELGAEVTAIDFSEAALERTAEICDNNPRLRTRRVDLLDIPSDIGEFDLVFSFGVLHHTGDTWRALENVARLVSPSGAFVLYLYGAQSWSPSETGRIERLRLELAMLPFEEKIVELRRRFPGDDPHQLFDLLSPVINDRVTLTEVTRRLSGLGFASVDPTIAHSEVYVRASRGLFAPSHMLPVIGSKSTFLEESGERWNVRRGAAFESGLRAALGDVLPRSPSPAVLRTIRDSAPNGVLVDLSLPPDRVPAELIGHGRPHHLFDHCPIDPNAQPEVRGDCVVFLGAAVGACRFPERMLRRAWAMVKPGGMLAIELSTSVIPSARRTYLDRARIEHVICPGRRTRYLSADANGPRGMRYRRSAAPVC
ncbi:MAG TPA: class I SAM-dependent methyltransferase [Gemmatimonadaceae bacterium]|nr:class I SAM-dependent methyltransferase [Gemmatimonadaceae bacterium]